MPPLSPPDVDRRPSRWLILLNWKVTLPLLALFLGLISPVVHRGSRLSMLPEVPEPFDVEAFRNPDIPDSENALIEYFEILDDPLLNNPWYESDDADEEAACERLMSGDASQLTSRQRDRLERCGSLLEIWFKGTQKPRVGFVDPFAYPVSIGCVRSIWMLVAARIHLECEAQRPEEALKWLRALVRFSRQLGGHGGGIGNRLSVMLALRSLRMEMDALHLLNVKSEVLRQLADDLIADWREYAVPASDIVRYQFISDAVVVEDPEVWEALADFYPDVGLWSFRAWTLGEPELSRRYIRAMAANQLRALDLPADQRPVQFPGGAFDFSTTEPGEVPGTVLEATLHQKSKPAAAAFSHTTRDNVDGWLGWDRQNRLIQSLLIASLHVHAFAREHGRLPESLAECVPPELLQEIVDPHSASGAPLRFQRDGSQVLLYSELLAPCFPDGVTIDDRWTLRCRNDWPSGIQIVMPGDDDSIKTDPATGR